MKMENFERFYSFRERYTLQSQMVEFNGKIKKESVGRM